MRSTNGSHGLSHSSNKTVIWGTLALKSAIDNLVVGYLHYQNAQRITSIVHRAFAIAELAAPTSAQGAFIPAGNALDAFAAIEKVLGEAKSDVLIVDPYMDSKAVTDFATVTADGISIRLLADAHDCKPTLGPAAKRWSIQFPARPFEVRLSSSRSLHDRVIIIDERDVWILTQSLKDFATRAPGSIIRVDPETAALKVAAYNQLWAAAAALP